MGSNAFLFLGLLLAIFIISSQVLASENDHYGGGYHGGGHHGGGHGGYPGGGHHGGGHGGYPGGGHP
ncbi:hypothetical protein P3L10_013065 [Capsicum annuum]